MILSADTTEETCSVAVDGEFRGEQDEKRFFQTITEQIRKKLEVTFFTARILPVSVICFLQNIKKLFPETKLKVFTFTRPLFTYLLQLGIENHFVKKKCLFPQRITPECKALVLAGSAESTDKICTIIKELPLKEISIFVIQHVQEKRTNNLGRILQRYTPYRVITPQHKTVVKKRTVYVAPAGCHMRVRSGLIHLGHDEPLHYARPSIGALFASLSDEYKENLVAVLLCGYGEDGVHELKGLKERNATIIIENPSDSPAGALPENAIKSGNFHHIFSIDALSRYLYYLLSEKDDFEHCVSLFLEDIHAVCGYDFRNYQKTSIIRRIKNFMLVEDIPSLHQCQEELFEEPQRIEELLTDVTVNVTQFFRDPEELKIVKDEIFPQLNRYSHIKIWCAGCSSGEEAYSLAIILQELNMLEKTLIYATDLDENMTQQARNGLFSARDIKENEANYRKAGGEHSFKDAINLQGSFFQIKSSLKEKILFFRHSLTNPGIINEFHLILCRNVMIYFNIELQSHVLKLFENSLSEEGFLMLGKNESIMPPSWKKKFKRYQRNKALFYLAQPTER